MKHTKCWCFVLHSTCPWFCLKFSFYVLNKTFHAPKAFIYSNSRRGVTIFCDSGTSFYSIKNVQCSYKNATSYSTTIIYHKSTQVNGDCFLLSTFTILINLSPFIWVSTLYSKTFVLQDTLHCVVTYSITRNRQTQHNLQLRIALLS